MLSNMMNIIKDQNQESDSDFAPMSAIVDEPSKSQKAQKR